MKKIFTFLIFIQVSFLHFGQIIADHTVVDKYDDIPQEWIDEVKTMWLVYAGESHSAAIRTGLNLLEGLDARYAVNIIESGTPEAYTASHLRASRATWGDLNNESGWIYSYGEEDWFTSETAINRTKAGITYCDAYNLTIGAFGFGWCWDPAIDSPVEFQTYIDATQEYIDHCVNNDISTQVIFTTGTVDDYTGETGYNKHLGYEMIRDYVTANGGVLFDYADILCYDNGANEPNTTTWDAHTYPIITTLNVSPEQTGHISNVGALRLAKAMWWMLARIAGWDGNVGTVPVTQIIVTSAGDVTEIETGETLQFSAQVLPSDATNQSVTWSVTNQTGTATITQSGLLTATSAGTVNVVATALDGSGVSGSQQLTITEPEVLVTQITVSSAGGATEIETGETLQFSAQVLPSDATNKSVTWSVTNQTGTATITQTGLLTATSAGTVNVVATAQDGSGVTGSKQLTITEPEVLVTQITVTSEGGLTEIETGETLQYSAQVLPSDATNKSVAWSVTNQTGTATITQAGLLTATSAGTVNVVATASDGSGVTGSKQLTITAPEVLVTQITVTSTGNVTEIETGETLQYSAQVLPSDATNKSVTWSVTNQTGTATITQAGLLTATKAGTVKVVATAQDGSGVTGSRQLTITEPEVLTTQITVTSAGGLTEIETGETLQFSAQVLPSDASNQSVTWSVTNQTGAATITQAGLLTATSAGTVNVVATAQDGSGVSGSKQLTITEPEVLVTQITVTSAADVTEIETGETLQYSAQVLPSDATNKSVTWSVTNQTGTATITQAGLLTATSAGTVNVVATAQDGSGVSGSKQLTITEPEVLVTQITVTSAGDVTEIETGETLQYSVQVLPSDATNKSVTWSVTNQTGTATITQAGLLTATKAGTVNVVATAQDGSGVSGSKQLTITEPEVLVTQITVSSAGGVTEIETGETLQYSAQVLPSDASNQSVTWSVTNKTGTATITQTGLLTTTSAGTVNVLATAQDGSGVSGSKQLTITEPEVLVTQITVSSAGGLTEIETGETLQFSAQVLPSDATNKSVTWSVTNQTGTATITQAGLVTSTSAGTVNVVATAQDGSGISGSKQLMITEPEVLVTQITVTSAGDVTEIETGETLQFSAQLYPENASVKNITWSVENLTGEAIISQSGLLTANSAGTVNVIAAAMDGSGVEGNMQVTITDPIFLVTQISVISVGGVTEMFTNEILPFLVEVIPANATNKNIIWSVENETGSGNIDQSGILTATSAGTVNVVASAQDGSGVTGFMQITIIDPTVLVSQIIVISEGGVTEIHTGDTLQFSAEIIPFDATNKEIVWSVESITGDASITQSGILIAVSEGIVDVIATALDGSGITGIQSIMIENQIIPPEETDTLIVNVFPNPGNGFFYLDVGNAEAKLIQAICDNGLVIMELIPEPGMHVIPVDMSAFPLGNYIIKVFGEGMAVGKAVIKH